MDILWVDVLLDAAPAADSEVVACAALWSA